MKKLQTNIKKNSLNNKTLYLIIIIKGTKFFVEATYRLNIKNKSQRNKQ